MATILDVVFLEQFSDIFLFVAVFVGLYVGLSFVGVFQRNKMFNAILSFISAYFLIITPLAAQAVKQGLPWAVVLFVLIVLGLAILGTTKGGENVFPKEYAGLITVVFLLIGMMFTATNARNSIEVPGDNLTAGEYDRDYRDTADTLFSPQMMGAGLMFLVAIAAIALLARDNVV